MNKKILPLLIPLLIFVAFFALPAPAQAFEGRNGDTVVIPAGEVVADDVYAAGQTITVQGTIQGDLVAVGTTITIAQGGVIEGDLIAAAQSVVIEGQVMDDARIAGAALAVRPEGQIGEDLISAGYSLETAAGSTVGRDVLFGGAQALLAGDIGDDLKVAANAVNIQGSVAGDATIEVGEDQGMPPFSPFAFIPDMPPVPSVPGGLTVSQGAQIGGDLSYTSSQEESVPAGVVGGSVSQTIRPTPVPPSEEEGEAVVIPRREPSGTLAILGWFRRNLANLLGLLVVGLLAVWLAPRLVQDSAEALRSKPLPSLGWGLVVLLGFFILLFALIAILVTLAIVLGVITLGDLLGTTIWGGMLAFGGFVFAFVFAANYLAQIVVSFLAGRWLVGLIKAEWAVKPWLPLIVGVIIFAILVAIPFLGWLINFVVVLFGLGALWLFVQERFRRQPLAAPVPAAAD